MRFALRVVAGFLPVLLLVLLAVPAQADDPKIPVPVLPDIPAPPLRCRASATARTRRLRSHRATASRASSPGSRTRCRPQAIRSRRGPSTTIYEQYGYAGLRWRTYDLGCGPDAMRSPDAVIGTAVSNWIMQAPVALTALTGALTGVAFRPTFLDTFDPVVERVSSSLHENLFASWIPVVLVLLGFIDHLHGPAEGLCLDGRRRRLGTDRGDPCDGSLPWPIEAGHAADATVSGTVGEVVGHLDGDDTDTDPGTAVASQVNEAILYRSWLAGTLGSPDSATAKKYGAELFQAQALTWREAREAQKSPERAKAIIEAKQEQWTETADKIKEEDPESTSTSPEAARRHGSATRCCPH